MSKDQIPKTKEAGPSAMMQLRKRSYFQKVKNHTTKISKRLNPIQSSLNGKNFHKETNKLKLAKFKQELFFFINRRI